MWGLFFLGVAYWGGRVLDPSTVERSADHHVRNGVAKQNNSF